MSQKSALVFVVVYLLVIIQTAVKADDELNSINDEMEPSFDPRDKVMDRIITMYEKAAEKLATNTDSVTDNEEDSFHKQMVATIDTIMELMKNPNNVFRFLKHNGLERVVFPHLQTQHQNMKIHLLKLIKVVFETAPTATSLTIPVETIDTFLDIFENGNPPMKAHVLDILNMWLPGNPKAQIRLMKRDGIIELFYKQIVKLDPITVNQVMVVLLNKILVEHLNARDEMKVETTTDVLNLAIYKRIRFLEQLSNAKVCRGLLYVFTQSSYVDDENSIVPVLELLNNIKTLCLQYYGGNEKVLSTLKDYLKHVENVESMKDNDLVSVLREYIAALQRKSKKIKEDL